MARIRTTKPDFWDHEGIGALSRDARLLYIASWNLADDEGLVRWQSTFIKANVFLYDDDLTLKRVDALMAELVLSGRVFPYVGGTARQRLGWVVNFRKHQRINRPQPSKLPAPSLQNQQVRELYAERDDWMCHLCGGEIDRPSEAMRRDFSLSLDHLVPRVRGGSDYPSNVRAAHLSCNQSKRDGSTEPRTVNSRTDSLNRAVNGSPSGSVAEGKGKGREEEREGTRARAAAQHLAPSPDPSLARCTKHAGDPNPPNCYPCGEARKAAEQAQHDHLSAVRAAVRSCGWCDIEGWRIDPANPHRGPLAPGQRCDHSPLPAAAAVS